jgi:hypothetical protein
MTTEKQEQPAQENPQEKGAQTSEEKPLSRPKRNKRAKPGTKGEGDYFRITVRPKGEFSIFRYHDVGEKGHMQRLAGKRSSGYWDTHVWLISKEDAHLEGDTLIPDTEDARNLIEDLGSTPKHIKEDVFEAKDRPNIPESEKPTEAQQSRRAHVEKKE